MVHFVTVISGFVAEHTAQRTIAIIDKCPTACIIAEICLTVVEQGMCEVFSGTYTFCDNVVLKALRFSQPGFYKPTPFRRWVIKDKKEYLGNERKETRKSALQRIALAIFVNLSTQDHDSLYESPDFDAYRANRRDTECTAGKQQAGR